MKTRFGWLAVLTVVLLVSSAFCKESDFVKVLEMDLTKERASSFTPFDALTDSNKWLKRNDTSDLDYIITKNGLWQKSKTEIMAPVILTGDFEISITIFTIGIFPKADSLSSMFQPKITRPSGVFAAIEMWPYAKTMSETLSGAVSRIFTGKYNGNSVYTSYQSQMPFRFVIEKNETSVWFSENATIYSNDNYSPNLFYSVNWKREKINNVQADGLQEVILQRQGEYLLLSFNGVIYDLSYLKEKFNFDIKQPLLLSFRGNKQTGIVPSLTEAIFLSSVRIAAQEGTFYPILDVINAQK